MQNKTDHSEETVISDCDKKKQKNGSMAENSPKKAQNGGKYTNICSRYVI